MAARPITEIAFRTGEVFGSVSGWAQACQSAGNNSVLYHNQRLPIRVIFHPALCRSLSTRVVRGDRTGETVEQLQAHWRRGQGTVHEPIELNLSASTVQYLEHNRTAEVVGGALQYCSLVSSARSHHLSTTAFQNSWQFVSVVAFTSHIYSTVFGAEGYRTIMAYT